MIPVADNSTVTPVSVPAATLAIKSHHLEPVSKAKHPMVIPTAVVLSIMSVSNAQKDPSSTHRVSVLLLTLPVSPITNSMELALAAILASKSQNSVVVPNLKLPKVTPTAKHLALMEFAKSVQMELSSIHSESA